VTLRQDALLESLDTRLVSKFAPRHLSATVDELASTTAGQPGPSCAEDDLKAKITECDRKLAQYRATLDAGADPASVARWITEPKRSEQSTRPPSMPSHSAPHHR
jgi:site-specific DNA recombinase